jgi:hypothetical protein
MNQRMHLEEPLSDGTVQYKSHLPVLLMASRAATAGVTSNPISVFASL